MKVLWLTPTLPFPPDDGGKLRIYNILSRIARRHEVHLAATFNPGEPKPIIDRSMLGVASIISLEGRLETGLWHKLVANLSLTPRVSSSMISRQGIVKLELELTTHNFDVAVVEGIHMTGYLHHLLRAGVPAILVCHNVEWQLWRGYARFRKSRKTRILSRLEAEKLRHYEARQLRLATHRVAVSVQDQRELEQLSGVQCGLSPNGVDTDVFTFQPLQAHQAGQPWRLVMTGTMGYPPNLDAAIYFLDEIFPEVQAVSPSTQVWFVGRNPTSDLTSRERPDGAVRFTGYVDDVRPYVAQSDVFIVPLRHGSGTRLKILEAMAQGIPVVSTSIGCEGLDVRHKEHLWIADTPEAFAEGIIAIMQHPAAAGAMAARARLLVEQRYSWNDIARRFEDDLFHIARQSVAISARELPTHE